MPTQRPARSPICVPRRLLKTNDGKHQQAGGEDDRHDARLVDLQRQVLPGAAEDPPAADVLGRLRRDAPLALGDRDHADDHGDEQHDQQHELLEADAVLAAPPSVKTRASKLPSSKSSVAVAAGMRATMPAMMSRLMPLPMPYSSICSPSHIRKIVPAVMMHDA